MGGLPIRSSAPKVQALGSPMPKTTTPKMSRLSALALTVFSIFCGCLTAAAQSVWTTQDSNSEDGLTAVTYGGGLFVAVGDPGVIVTSTDGVNWTAQSAGTDEALRGVAYGGGVYVAVGAGGTALSSTTKHTNFFWFNI